MTSDEEIKKAKNQKQKLATFRGAQISQLDAEGLQMLETQIGKRSYLVKKNERYLEFMVENNRIIGISLKKCKISSLPDSLMDFKSLKALFLGSNKFTTLPESINLISQ